MLLDLSLHSSTAHDMAGRQRLLHALGSLELGAQAVIRVVAHRADDGPAPLFFGEIVIGPNIDPGPSLDLGQIVVRSEVVPVESLVRRLENAFRKDQFPCGDIVIDTTKIFHAWGMTRYPSQNNYSHWPCMVAQSSGHPMGANSGPFVADDHGELRYFHDPFELVSHITTFPIFNFDSDGRLWRFSVVIEDPRARIAGIERNLDILTIHVEGKSIANLVLSGRIATREALDPFHEPASPKVERPIPPSRVHVGVALVGEDGDMLDAVSGYLTAPEPLSPTSPLLEQDRADTIRKLLADGENAKREYKPWVKHSGSEPKLKELIRTAVAMANSEGGVIIVGADDDGSVCSFDYKVLQPFMSPAPEIAVPEDALPPDPLTRQLEAVDSYGRRLRDLLRKRIEPSLELTLEVVALDAGPVLLLWIDPGPIPPYMIGEGQGLYVRRNATNRPPNRQELRELHERAKRT